MSLPASRFFTIADIIQKREIDEWRDRMRMVSFAAWQVTNYIGGAFGEKQRSFLDHLESLGLMTEEDREMQRNIKKLQQQQDKELAKQAHATADKIVAMDKARFKNNR